MECTRLVAAVVAIATAFGIISAVGVAPAPVHVVAAPVAASDGAAGPVVRLWAAPPEGAVTAANRAW